MRFKDWHTEITAADAEAEPEAIRLFGPSYEARQARLRGQPGGINREKFSPWKKPRIERGKEVARDAQK